MTNPKKPVFDTTDLEKEIKEDVKYYQENPSGLTISKIADVLEETRYKISEEVHNLVGMMKLEIVKIGNYKVVKIR